MSDSPFNQIIKPNNDLYLIPKSGSYKYVFIFIHGLYASPKTYVNLFDKKDLMDQSLPKDRAPESIKNKSTPILEQLLKKSAINQLKDGTT